MTAAGAGAAEVAGAGTVSALVADDMATGGAEAASGADEAAAVELTAGVVLCAEPKLCGIAAGGAEVGSEVANGAADGALMATDTEVVATGTVNADEVSAPGRELSPPVVLKEPVQFEGNPGPPP